jgi:hypothetical protein
MFVGNVFDRLGKNTRDRETLKSEEGGSACPVTAGNVADAIERTKRWHGVRSIAEIPDHPGDTRGAGSAPPLDPDLNILILVGK